MKTRLFLLSLLLLVFFQDIFSHAVVTDHSFRVGQPKAMVAKKVELTFNSKIEIGLSQIFLVSKGDKQTPLAINKGEKQGNVVVEIPPLQPGEYALMYKIFASDGHLTEDVIHFSIKP